MSVIASVVLLLATASSSHGAYPRPIDDQVNDFAGVIKASDAQSIKRAFADLERQTGIEATIVTVKSIRSYGVAAPDIETFASGLFNDWGIGHKKENNGVLILVSVDDRECRIELGEAYGRRYDARMKGVVEERMIPYFKEGDYSRGIYEGAVGVQATITTKVSWLEFYKWHIVIGILMAICVLAGISCMRAGKKGWGWAFFAVAGALLVLLIKVGGKGRASRGFGGGRAGGGGASGRW